MQDRDLDITKFSYHSYRNFKKSLGEFDAVVECNELAIREFLDKLKTEDPQKYIEQLSLKYQVKVDEVDISKFTARIRQYYISSVLQQTEQFIKDFKTEWRRYYPEGEWLDLKNGETAFQNIVRNLDLPIHADCSIVYDYYRLIRNYMTHTDRNIDKIHDLHSDITSNQNEFLNKMKLNVKPSSINNINFDDFLILTNVVKHFAYLSSISGKPENTRIAQILLNKAKTKESNTFRGLKKLKNKKLRYENAIKNFINTEFGRFSQSDEFEIMDKLKSLLA